MFVCPSDFLSFSFINVVICTKECNHCHSHLCSQVLKSYCQQHLQFFRIHFSAVAVVVLIIWIRCNFWFNAGSRIIENKFKGCSFLFLAPLTLQGTILIIYLRLQGKGNLYLTSPDLILLFFIILTSNILPGSATDPIF